MSTDAERMAEAPVDEEVAYRRALGGFGTGVVLVAAEDAAGRAHGLIVNSFTSVSLKPPIVLWCLANTCKVFDVYAQAPAFSLNFLSVEDEARARQFSNRGSDRILDPGHLERMETGAPVLATALASFDCRVWKRETVGDHEVIYGEVAAWRATGAGDALGYYRGKFVKLSHE